MLRDGLRASGTPPYVRTSGRKARNPPSGRDFGVAFRPSWPLCNRLRNSRRTGVPARALGWHRARICGYCHARLGDYGHGGFGGRHGGCFGSLRIGVVKRGRERCRTGVANDGGRGHSTPALSASRRAVRCGGARRGGSARGLRRHAVARPGADRLSQFQGPAAPQAHRQGPRPAEQERERADARPGRRDSLRQRQRSRDRRSAMCRSTTAGRPSKPTRWSTTSAPSGCMPRAMRA